MLTSLLASLVHSWWTWLLGIGGLVAGLSWIPGVGTVLTLASAGLTMLAPLVNGLLTGIIWVWKTVLWPGLLNILGNWASIFTVIFIVGCTYLYFVTRYEFRHLRDGHALYQCQKNIKPSEDTFPEIGLSLPWPFNFKL